MGVTARSVIEISTGETAVPERPEAKIKIGSATYVVRAPKIDVWRETTALLAKIDLARELASEADLPPEDAAQRDALEIELSDLSRLEEAIIVGREIRDPETNALVRLDGGFLRRALSKEDWAKVYEEWKDDDSDLDLDTLFTVANLVQEHFSPWFAQRQNVTGLPEVSKPKRASKSTGTPSRARTAKAK